MYDLSGACGEMGLHGFRWITTYNYNSVVGLHIVFYTVLVGLRAFGQLIELFNCYSLLCISALKVVGDTLGITKI